MTVPDAPAPTGALRVPGVRRWLVTGAGGMLGGDVVRVLSGAGQDVVAAGRADLDVRDVTSCRRAVPGFDVVVNLAAWTAVDDAESHEGEAFAINALGAANLAGAARAAGARLVQVSTDYVFDGTSSIPCREDAPVAPRSAYGRTKAAGEWAARAGHDDVLVLRTAWLYGAGGRCFPRTIAAALAERDVLDVVDDQVGQPTWTLDVASLVLAMVVAEAPPGTYHATSSGQTSWYGFAQEVARAVGADPARVRPTTSAGTARAASRPAWSVLGHDALRSDGLRAAGVHPIGDWRDRFVEAAPAVLGTAGG